MDVDRLGVTALYEFVERAISRRTRFRALDNIDEYIDVLKARAETYPYTVGWIDCLSTGKRLGRGTMISGDWADPREAPTYPALPKQAHTFPVDLPTWALSQTSVRAFNALNHWRHLPRTVESTVHWESFFYPLDRVRAWNRMYGKRGFTQYQCVLPDSAGRGAARRLLERVSERGGASFLCVIKDCGQANRGLLSFPMKGVSIALDIAMRDDTQSLIDALNELVIGEGGRIYLAKDQLTRPEHFRAMERSRLGPFLEARDRWDPERRIRSAQSVRLFGINAGPPHWLDTSELCRDECVVQNHSPALACLGNLPAPDEVRRDLEWHLRWPPTAVDELWTVLAPALQSRLDPRLESELAAFGTKHGVDGVELALFLKAMRFLLLEASGRRTSWEDFAADLVALLGDRALPLSTTLGGSYAKVTEAVRFDIMRAALLDHGHIYVGGEWRLDAVLASTRARSLGARVALLTLKYRSQAGADQLTLQVLPADLLHLRAMIDDLLEATEAHRPEA